MPGGRDVNLPQVLDELTRVHTLCLKIITLATMIEPYLSQALWTQLLRVGTSHLFPFLLQTSRCEESLLHLSILWVGFLRVCCNLPCESLVRSKEESRQEVPKPLALWSPGLHFLLTHIHPLAICYSCWITELLTFLLGLMACSRVCPSKYLLKPCLSL